MRVPAVIGLTLLSTLLSTWAGAQTPPAATFTASADHAVTVGTTAVVTGYQLDVMIGSATGALAFSKTLGKPTPDATNTIRVTLPEFLTKGSGVYVGTVSAVGPGGTGRSVPSDPFSWVVAPVPPGKPVIAFPVP